MIHQALIAPQSIAVIGASSSTQKPGGKALRNLLEHGYKGRLYAVNAGDLDISGALHFRSSKELPQVDLAILAIPARACLDELDVLLEKGVKAFIIYSAGFSEAGEQGKILERQLLQKVNEANACLIGPNCIGVINGNYKGVFTSPVPEYDPNGCELVSGSGATAVFIMEAAASSGLRFSNVYSIGNATQNGVEELLEFMDHSFDPAVSPRVKLLYLEQISNPFKFLKHASSLIHKGCHIAAIKSGYSAAGSRAAASHTGALASSDAVVRALFKKAGVVYCSSRDELIAVGCVFQSRPLLGKRMAVITHAGGSAVILTDVMTSLGLEVPAIPSSRSEQLLASLQPGSSVANPIDFLATGTAKNLADIIDFCQEYEGIDAMVVVFGSSGLFNVRDVYQVLDQKMKSCTKPIYAVLPSVINARKEIEQFLRKGNVNFADEADLGRALPHVYFCPRPSFGMTHLAEMETATIRSLISQAQEGYLSAEMCRALLTAAGIPLVEERSCSSAEELEHILTNVRYPIALKLLGPVHKSELGGVLLNIADGDQARSAYAQLMQIKGAAGVAIQPMVAGAELFCGAIRQAAYGHLVVCGMGGIYVEILKDIASGLAPVSMEEALQLVRSLRCYPIFEGYRKQTPVDERAFADLIVRVASLVHLAPEIAELDLNPIKAEGSKVLAVDYRICIRKQG